jgi:hypothetical protein
MAADIANAAYRAELLRMAEAWEREAEAADAARARREALRRG